MKTSVFSLFQIFNNICSESGEQRCPVDNTTVIRDQVFPDNFAKREILSLQVKCPKSKEGCKVIEVLKQLPVSTII